MAAAIGLREDYAGDDLRRLARQSRDGRQVRRLLALAAIYDGVSRTEAARVGGVTLQIVHFGDRRADGHRDPPVVEAMAEASEQGRVTVTPVRPEIDVPFVPMVASLSIGLRADDQALRDLLDVALARTWDETRAILEAAGMPLLSLPRPTGGEGGG